MSALCVTVIVTEESRILSSDILREEIPMLAHEADEFRENLKKWLGEFPTPGTKKDEVDRVSELAVELSTILTPRDPIAFGPHYMDKEGEAAIIDHRPYDWANLEVPV